MRFLKHLTAITLILQCVLPCMSQYARAESSQQQNTVQSNAPRSSYNPLGGPEYPLDEDAYFTDDNGNILMNINILGEVNKQGPMVVKEKVDFAKILALAGGVKSEADLKQVMVVRQEPDSNGKTVYVVDLKKYYKLGDRTAFIAFKPNDTIIIPEKGLSLAKIANVFGFVFSTATGVYYIKHM